MRRILRTACAIVPALTGCVDSDPKFQPVTLSYPYVIGDEALLAGYEDVARQASGSYVRVLILAKTAPWDEGGTGIVSGASGAIVDARGYVVTAAHIAKRTGYNAKITTIDGKVHQGAVVHVDPPRELALLKIEPFPGMQVAAFADSRHLRLGQLVISIGTPDNRKGVISLGRITNTRLMERIEYDGYGYDDAVVLDMEIEPGHSGGPVFDADGNLVGIVASFGLGNTRRVPYVSTRIAYAVPSAAIAAYLAEVLAR